MVPEILSAPIPATGALLGISLAGMVAALAWGGRHLLRVMRLRKILALEDRKYALEMGVAPTRPERLANLWIARDLGDKIERLRKKTGIR